MFNRASSENQPNHGGNVLWAAQVANCPPSMILDFSASINPLGPPQSAIAAIQNALGRLRDYPEPDYSELRKAIALIHDIDPDWILPGNGAAEILTWIGRDLAEHSSKNQLPIGLITPAFGDYRRAFSSFKSQIIQYPLNISSLCDSPNIINQGSNEIVDFCSSIDLSHAIHLSAENPFATAENQHDAFSSLDSLLINNPHNPTGLLFSAASLEKVFNQVPRVVIDEAFMDFLPPNDAQSLVQSIGSYPNLVILRSLTKFYSLPGLRIGYAIAHPDRLKRWQLWRDPWPVNTLAEAAAIAVLNDDDFQATTLTWLAQARAQLYHGLQNIPGLLPYPSAANFLLVRSEMSTLILQQWLLKHHHILIRDCESFPELGDRYFRVAVRTEAENKRLITALTEALTM